MIIWIEWYDLYDDKHIKLFDDAQECQDWLYMNFDPRMDDFTRIDIRVFTKESIK